MLRPRIEMHVRARAFDVCVALAKAGQVQTGSNKAVDLINATEHAYLVRVGTLAGHAYHAAVCALDRWLWEKARSGRALPVTFATGGAAAAIAVEAISETLRAHDTPASAAAVAWSLGRHAIRLDVAFADWGLAPRTITLGADEPEEWFGASTETRAVDNFAWGSP